MNSGKNALTIGSLFEEQSSIAIQTVWIFLFAGLTAIGAQIQIPHSPVPFTLQTFFVLLSAAFLGARNGSISQLLYIAVGIGGIPVFTAGGFGIARLLSPTGGYLLSFPIASIIIGSLIRQHTGYLWTLISMTSGLLCIFAIGTFVLYMGFVHNISTALISGFLIFSWWDILKLMAAAAIYTELRKLYKKYSS